MEFARDLFSRGEAQPTGETYEGRPVVSNPDGTFSHERTITIGIDGRFYNIPTMFKGKSVTEDEAVKIITKNKFVDPDTGKKIQAFSSLQEALKSAQDKEKRQQGIFR